MTVLTMWALMAHIDTFGWPFLGSLVAKLTIGAIFALIWFTWYNWNQHRLPLTSADNHKDRPEALSSVTERPPPVEHSMQFRIAISVCFATTVGLALLVTWLYRSTWLNLLTWSALATTSFYIIWILRRPLYQATVDDRRAS